MGGPMIDVMPDPPLSGSSLNITTRFPGPTPFIPQVMIEFMGGNRRSFTFPGNPGMSEYSIVIPQSDVVNDVMAIEIKDPVVLQNIGITNAIGKPLAIQHQGILPGLAEGGYAACKKCCKKDLFQCHPETVLIRKKRGCQELNTLF